MQNYPVAHRSHLIARGMSIRQISAAVHDGRLIRVRQGWYAAPDAPQEVVQAVRVGGSLTSLSATSLTTIWTPPDSFLHVAVPRNASRLRAPHARSRPLARKRDRVCIHHLADSGVIHEPVQTNARALAHAAQCQTEEMALTVIDSALERSSRAFLDDVGACSRRPSDGASRESRRSSECGCASWEST
jgi:hypothetical protein